MFKIFKDIPSRDLSPNGNFTLVLETGYKISVAVGGSTYSTGTWEDGFLSAEIAVIDPNDEFVDQGSGSGVEGWQSVDKFIEILNRVNAIPTTDRAEEMVREIEDTLIRLRMLDLTAAKELAVRNGLVKDDVPTQAGIDFLSAFSDQPGTRSVFR